MQQDDQFGKGSGSNMSEEELMERKRQEGPRDGGMKDSSGTQGEVVGGGSSNKQGGSQGGAKNFNVDQKSGGEGGSK